MKKGLLILWKKCIYKKLYKLWIRNVCFWISLWEEIKIVIKFFKIYVFRMIIFIIYCNEGCMIFGIGEL